MVARIRRNWRLFAGLCCLSLALLLCLGAYKAFGQIPPVTQPTGPTVGFTESSYTVGQGQNIEIVVALNAPAQQDVTIDYATSDGTAKAGVDYRETSGTLTIPAGALSGKITVATIANQHGSPSPTLSISLRSPSNAKLGSSTVRAFVGPNGSTCQ
jgi:hypothetical protein